MKDESKVTLRDESGHESHATLVNVTPPEVYARCSVEAKHPELWDGLASVGPVRPI